MNNKKNLLIFLISFSIHSSDKYKKSDQEIKEIKEKNVEEIKKVNEQKPLIQHFMFSCKNLEELHSEIKKCTEINDLLKIDDETSELSKYLNLNDLDNKFGLIKIYNELIIQLIKYDVPKYVDNLQEKIDFILSQKTQINN